jgi:hypothetical protein
MQVDLLLMIILVVEVGVLLLLNILDHGMPDLVLILVNFVD